MVDFKVTPTIPKFPNFEKNINIKCYSTNLIFDHFYLYRHFPHMHSLYLITSRLPHPLSKIYPCLRQ